MQNFYGYHQVPKVHEFKPFEMSTIIKIQKFQEVLLRIREYSKEEKIGDFVIVDGEISADAIIANRQINKIDNKMLL